MTELDLNILSLNYVTSCTMVFFRFFMRTRMIFFPENNNMMHRYFALSCHALTCPIKANIDRYKDHLIFWRQKGRSVNICWHDFSEWIFIVRLCFVTNNKLTQTVAWLIVWGLIQISHEILIWTYNADSEKLQLNLM